MKSIYRCVLCLAVIMSTAHGLRSQFVPGRDAIVLRKNIDALSPEELASYEFALKVMKERSDLNPYDKTGFAWQAWVHNRTDILVPKSAKDQKKINRQVFNSLDKGNRTKSDRDYYEWVVSLKKNDFKKYGISIGAITDGHPGKCEHGTELFLLWHRGEFYYFEQIIREILKENNRPLVGVPYWNYTQPPSGLRYPKAFEDSTSVLYHKYRAQGQVVSAALSRAEFSELIRDRSWAEFAGETYIRSDFESRMHDYIHGIYVGREPKKGPKHSMWSTLTAAYDPIFFSFHAYIDYALDAWLSLHEHPHKDSLDLALRAEQEPKFHLKGNQSKEGNMGFANLYLESIDVGYKFEVGDLDRLMTLEELREVTKDMYGNDLVFGQSAMSPFYALSTFNSTYRPGENLGEVLEQDSLKRDIDIIPKVTSGSYQVDVYVFPKDQGINPFISDLGAERKFRRDFMMKYFAYGGAKWEDGTHQEHHQTSAGIHIRLKGVNEALSKLYPGRDLKKDYRVIINLTN